MNLFLAVLAAVGLGALGFAITLLIFALVGLWVRR